MGLGNDPITKALSDVTSIVTDVEKLFSIVASEIGVGNLLTLITKFVNLHKHRWSDILTSGDVALQEADELLGRPWVDSFLNLGLGLDTNKTDKDTAPALKTFRMMIGFCIVLAFVPEAVKLLVKIPGANRIPDTFLDHIAKIPDEMGMSWALGMMMNTAFEQSVGQSFEEWINVQKHPARLNVQELMRLLRQHKMPEADVDFWMNKLGFSDDLKKLMKLMDSTQLPLTDIISARLNNFINDDQLKAYVQSLGYVAKPQKLAYTKQSDSKHEYEIEVPSDADIVLNTYWEKAQTQASALARTSARRAYLDYLISDNQFVAMLRTASVPDISITQELSTLKFERKHILDMEKVNAIKRNYIARVYDRPHVYQLLENMAMSHADITSLLDSWDESIQSRRPALTSTKVLALYKNEILDRTSAMNHLTDLGYYPTNANLLLDHPDTKSQSGGIPFTKANILTAYTDKIISIGTTRQLLGRLGLSSTDIKYELDIVDYTIKHVGKVINPGQALSVDVIHSSWSNNQLSDLDVITLLEEDGYAITDAEVMWASWYMSRYGKAPPGDAPAPTP